MLLTMSADEGLIHVTADRHIPGDSNITDDSGNGPGNPNPLVPKGPRDLYRSRRVGLSQTVCASCGAIKDENPTVHKPGCTTDFTAPEWVRWRQEFTGAIARNATSRDMTWWRLT